MESLIDKLPQESFQLLLRLAQVLDGTLRLVGTGDGTELPIQVSTGGVNFTGFAKVGGAVIVTESTFATLLGNSGLSPAAFDPTAFDSATTSVKAPLRSFQNTIPVSLSAGTGIYTAILALDIATAAKGNVVFVTADLPAVAGRTLEIRNASGAGDLLASISSQAAATSAGVAFYYTGTAWKSLNQAFQTTP